MASTKHQKPTNEEHKFSQKISEMTSWGSKVFGHKQQEQNQGAPKHCTTCQCPASKDTKPTYVDTKSGAGNPDICTWLETKKKEKDEKPNTVVHKDSKHRTCMDFKKKEKKDRHEKINTSNASTTVGKKEHKDEAANHCFSSMADHWKEKIMMMKKGRDEKHKDSSSSSDSEDESRVMNKKEKKHSQETNTISK